jgi:hypothetical protein
MLGDQEHIDNIVKEVEAVLMIAYDEALTTVADPREIMVSRESAKLLATQAAKHMIVSAMAYHILAAELARQEHGTNEPVEWFVKMMESATEEDLPEQADVTWQDNNETM